MPLLEPTTPRLCCYVTAGALCLAACAPAEDWRGTIEEIDGVVHVSSPAEPLWGSSEEGESRLALELEQVFGVDRAPAEALLGNEYELDLDVDADGNVYVLDGQASQLVAFDSGGAVRWRAGRKGMGPGELYEPREVAVGPDGTVVAGNNSGKQLSLWDSAGHYLSSVSLFDRDGRLLYSLVERPGNTRQEGRWRSTGRPQFIGPDNRLYTIADEPFSQIRRYRVEIR